ncbi:MAG TPA: zonular occludens toxin domain-containing protein [Methylophilaceae bacterium]|jgi:zona occludens toxin
MITLFTGVPGIGKTSMVVAEMLKRQKQDDPTFFVMGINDLKVPHQRVPPIAEWTVKRPDPDDPTLQSDYFVFPPNSILVVDECQKVYRSRSSTSKVPDITAALETHRHTGLDIWLITQKPNQVDPHVLGLVEKHIHLKKNLLGMRYLYEWVEYHDPKVKTNFEEASKRKFSPPKHVFGLYSSAVAHTKVSMRMHNAVYLLALLIPLLIWNGYRIYDKHFSKHPDQLVEQPKPAIDPVTAQNATSAKQSPAIAEIKTNQSQPQELPHPYLGYDFTIKGAIHSARVNKIYFELTKDNHTVFIDDESLKKLGYAITEANDCSVFLFFNGAQVVASCATDQPNGQFELTKNPHTLEAVKAPSNPLPLLDPVRG